jgi:hypothetical protein
MNNLKNCKKQIISLVVAAAMTLSLIPAMSVSATGCDTCDLVVCTPCNPTGQFALGDVDGKDGVTIMDALEILKYLVGMTSTMTDEANPDREKSMRAAKITVKDDEIPTIMCVLEILKYLVGMTSLVDGETVHGGREFTPPEQNDGYLRIPEWDIKFQIPETITDIRYRIVTDEVGEWVYFVAKPTGADVEFAEDIDEKFLEYSNIRLFRTTEVENFPPSDIPQVGDYIFLPFPSVLTGAVFGNENDTNREYAGIVSAEIRGMFSSVQVLE